MEPNIDVTPPPSNNDLAFERTWLAHERTLLAWVRTSISMISFGFTIYKFLGETSKSAVRHPQLMTPRIVGMIMISFGLVALILAHRQQRKAVKILMKNYAAMPNSSSATMSIMVLAFGLLLFLGALLRQ